MNVTKMNAKTIYYFLVLIIILFFFVVFILQTFILQTKQTELFVVHDSKEEETEEEEEETEKTEIILDPAFQIGNYLSCYFYNMGVAFSLGKNYETSKVSMESSSFAKYLPTKVPLNRDVQSALLNAGITPQSLSEELKQIDGQCWSAWNVLTKEREMFWTIMKPLANRILKEALEKAGLNRVVDAPIIHYRCSDVPFTRLEYYHFQKYEYFKKILAKIREQTGSTNKKVYIFYCNTHKTDESQQQACDYYSSSLVSYLENLGYTAIVKCGKLDEDFATIFYAPAVIGTGGSFSFMAGFLSDGIFYSSMYDEQKDREIKDSDGWLFNGYTLKHAEVTDYYDTQTVIKSLQS
jgi:hypothetical protein